MHHSFIKVTGDDLGKLRHAMVVFLMLMEQEYQLLVLPDEQSLHILQDYIESYRHHDPGLSAAFAWGIGIVLGEAMIRSYGGHWVRYPDGSLAVMLACGAVAYCIERVYKQMENPNYTLIEFYRGAALLSQVAKQLKASGGASVTIEQGAVSLTAKRLE